MLAHSARRALSRAAGLTRRQAPCAFFSDSVAKKDEGEVAEVITAEDMLKKQNQIITPWMARDELHDHTGFVSGTTAAIADGEEGKLAGNTKYFEGRVATISKPAPHQSQSGSYKFRHWRISFDQKERWTNPMMGWASSADSLQQLDQLKFETKEQAIGFAQRQGWDFEVNDTNTYFEQKADFRGKKDYGDNFLSQWNKNQIARVGEKHFEYDETKGKSCWCNLERTEFGNDKWTDDGWKGYRSSLKK